MAIQPALGTKDLNPQEVQINQLLTSKLADLYKQWGYEEVSPSFINSKMVFNSSSEYSPYSLIDRPIYSSKWQK